MAATKAQLMTDIRENLAAAGRAFDHFQPGASDLDAVCAGLVEFLANEIAAGGVSLADGDYGDIVLSSSGTVWTIDADVVTNAKLAEVDTATFKGRTTSGTGNPEDLTVAQAKALLGIDVLEAATRHCFIAFYADATTAGDTSSYLNPVGAADATASNTTRLTVCPVNGNLTKIFYRSATAHTTSTVEIQPRIAGTDTDVNFDVAANDDRHDLTLASPIALSIGDSLACRIRHNGATNLAFTSVIFLIEY